MTKYICFTSPTECDIMNQSDEDWLNDYEGEPNETTTTQDRSDQQS